MSIASPPGPFLLFFSRAAVVLWSLLRPPGCGVTACLCHLRRPCSHPTRGLAAWPGRGQGEQGQRPAPAPAAGRPHRRHCWCPVLIRPVTHRVSIVPGQGFAPPHSPHRPRVQPGSAGTVPWRSPQPRRLGGRDECHRLPSFRGTVLRHTLQFLRSQQDRAGAPHAVSHQLSDTSLPRLPAAPLPSCVLASPPDTLLTPGLVCDVAGRTPN